MEELAGFNLVRQSGTVSTPEATADGELLYLREILQLFQPRPRRLPRRPPGVITLGHPAIDLARALSACRAEGWAWHTGWVLAVQQIGAARHPWGTYLVQARVAWMDAYKAADYEHHLEAVAMRPRQLR
jgi:hypothetical protein